MTKLGFRVCNYKLGPRAKGVGTIFDEIVKDESPFGKPRKCKRCIATLEKIDELSPEECGEQFDELVDEILDNAKHHKSLAGIAANMTPEKSREWIASRLERAIVRSAAAEARLREKVQE